MQEKIPKLNCDDPLWKALELGRTADTKSYRYIQAVLEDQSDIYMEDKSRRAEELKSSTSTKRATFVKINPSIQQHKLYKNDQLPEFKRIEFTRYRLSSHNLKVETGRWGRINRENRTCSCTTGGIQDEYHAVFRCDLTRNIRERYDIQSETLEELFDGMEEESLCDIFYELSKIFHR